MATKRLIELQSLVDSHARPFIIIDKDFKIVAVNEAYERAFGQHRRDIMGRTCYASTHGKDEPCYEHGEDCPYLQVFKDHPNKTYYHVHSDAVRGTRPVKIDVHTLEGAEGELYMGELMHCMSFEPQLPAKGVPMLGKSRRFLEVMEQLLAAARTDAPVLLMGETGTGKELAASFIHRNSERNERPYLTLDCSVLTEPLFESEVFGHEKGAYTGSVGEKPGLFELADGGTVFLDEIGELSAVLQAKLLRMVDTGEFRRVGGKTMRHANGRIVCATNRNLLDERVDFRKDLYHRIACVGIHMPPLRERQEDIPELARLFMGQVRDSVNPALELRDDGLAVLCQYHFPGNIRELRNILWEASVLNDGHVLDARAIRNVIDRRVAAQKLLARQADPEPEPDAASLKDVEAEHIAQLLRKHNGNRRMVAAALGVSERTLYRKLRRYDLT